ncbi:WD40 repeat domain-containing protein [Plantactinospora mayteni]|nr:WD40 repeat domain-containing protein [Plantactinospora mayteni]
MSEPGSIIVSSPPRGWIRDFDLVVLDGRLVLVGTPDRSHRACTWDPMADRWTEHRLDNPWLEESDGDYTELWALGAAVVDGRIVIGGGGDHQGFAMWDLETGQVRLSAQEGGMGSAVRADFGGRSMLVVGFPGTWSLQLWDPSVAEPDDDDASDDSELDQPSPYDLLVEVEELCSQSYASSAVAAGMLGDRPVVVAGGNDGGVLVWDIDEQCLLAEFDDLDQELCDFALAAVDGRTHVVAAGEHSLVRGDPETGKWAEPFTVPSGRISCLDAGTVNDRAIAVTGAEDGTICVWDLTQHRLLGQPFREHSGEVYGVRLTDLKHRPVVISTAHGDSVRVWELPL